MTCDPGCDKTVIRGLPCLTLVSIKLIGEEVRRAVTNQTKDAPGVMDVPLIPAANPNDRSFVAVRHSA